MLLPHQTTPSSLQHAHERVTGRLVTTEQHQHGGAAVVHVREKNLSFTLIFKPDHHKLQPTAGFCTERQHFVCLDPKVTRSGHERG